MTFTVDVISDVICPWCYVGKRRLEQAIRALNGQHEVRVRWHPFQLNPQMPKEGMNRREYRIAKFGSLEQSLALDAQMKEVGATEDIAFNCDLMTRTPNTIDCHRLIWQADQQGVQDAVMEAMFCAYYTAGKDISDRQTLLDVVAGAGLSRDRAEAMLNSDEGMNEIRAAEEHARRLGVQGVPLFIFNGELPLSGAQKPDVFLAAFDQLTASTRDGEGVCIIKSGEKPTC